MKPRWLAIVGRKGGTGKTTLALCLAAHYARAGRRVLLADLDPQGSATLAAGAAPSGADLAAVLSGTAAPQPATVAEGLALLAGGPELETLDAPRPLRDALAAFDRAAGDVALADMTPTQRRAVKDAAALADLLARLVNAEGKEA